jgi:protein tyrosine phosphatase
MRVKGNLDRLVRKEEFYHLNRYVDIMVYEDTRVKLHPRTDHFQEVDTYINACYVDVSRFYSDFMYSHHLV